MVTLLNPFRKNLPPKSRNYLGWTIFAFSGAVISIFICVGLITFVKNSVDGRDRAELLSLVQTIALLVNGEDISNLKGDESDIGSPVYIRVKNSLYNLHNVNSGSRFVYFMRSNSSKSKLIFLADSESPESEDYSPPGQVYEDTSDIQMTNYINAVPFVEGPYRDKWGEWISAYSPVWYQGNQVAIVGMDVDSSKWSKNIKSIQNVIISATFLAISWFILLGLYIQKVLRCVEMPEISDAKVKIHDK
jgi:hypothetical protein